MIKIKLLALGSMLSLSLFAQDLDVVQIESGKVKGSRSEDGKVISFKGIPFADPPVGNLRWRAPQAAKPWSGVLTCTTFSASPMQAKPAPFSMWSEEFLIPTEPISEDCLYVNVWSGTKKEKEKKAVLVWIYGGGFRSGGSACPIYDGESMARKGIVFVSLNYRVGIWGFFAHPELENDGEKSGNFGLLDQIAALQWVKRNISAFGGDPDNVTIAGQSAGSMSVNALVASPLAKDLFNKAIAQSGASFTKSNPTKSAAESEVLKLLSSVSFKTLSELRNLSNTELLKSFNGNFRPYIDGYVLPEHIADIFSKRKQNKVALLIGWNQDEGLMFSPVLNASDYKSSLLTSFGNQANRMLEFYPGASDAEAMQSQLDLSRDQTFGIHGYIWSVEQSKQNLPVFVYRFSRIVPAEGEYKKFKAFHTGEVPYAYNNLKFVKRPWEKVDHSLSDVMSSYWINFIKSGDPNSKELPNWPSFDNEKKLIIYFDEKSFVEKMRDANALDFLYALQNSKK